jgi:hypothetical protein
MSTTRRIRVGRGFCATAVLCLPRQLLESPVASELGHHLTLRIR